MAQWEADFNTSQECQGYPVLDFDDVQYILEEEHPSNLMVLCRALEGQETLVGYSYSYSEPWESTTVGNSAPAQGIMSPRPNRGTGKRKEVKTGTETSSLYIAELFIAESERGLGLGELLLAQTLYVHAWETSLSHLFVSSKNVGAVRCYLKFGYEKGLKPSGDLAHDLVMELPSLKASVALASGRFDKQLAEGIVGARKRRSPNNAASSRSTKPAAKLAPPALTSAKTPAITVRPDTTTPRSASTRGQDSAAAQRPRGLRVRTAQEGNKKGGASAPTNKPAKASVQPASKPALPHTPASDFSSAGRSKRSPLMSTNDTAGEEGPASVIKGRQRKIVRQSLEEVVRAGTRMLRNSNKRDVESESEEEDEDEEEEEHVMERRSMARSKFMVSLFSDGKRKVAEDRIKALGGEVISADYYDQRCTHLVAARPATTEKFLCATAAGKHILHPSFLEDCFEAGCFLDEEDYRWSYIAEDDNNLDDYGRGLAKAPIIWREKAKKLRARKERVAAPTGCFDGVVAVLLSTNDKQAGFKRILEAGGASVCSSLAEACRKAKRGASVADLLDKELGGEAATHVFVSKDVYELATEGWDHATFEAMMPVIEELEERGARFMFEDYIVEKIVRNVDMRAKQARELMIDASQWVDECRPRSTGGAFKRRAEVDDASRACSRRARTSLCDQAMRLMPVLWR